MSQLLLLFLCLASNDVWRAGNHLVLQQDGMVVVLDLDSPGSELRFQGKRLSLFKSGMLVERQRQIFLLSFSGEELQLLPDSGGEALPQSLPDVEQPAFLSETHLWLWVGEVWQSVALPVWYEYHTSKPIAGSLSGFQPLPPYVFSAGPGAVCFYQQKDGRWLSFHFDGGHQTEDQMAPKMRPIPVGSDLFWIGAPKKNSLGLFQNRPGSPLDAARTIANLSRYSLALPGVDGLWLLTFDDGLRAGLRSWDKGTVEVTAHFAQRQGKQLRVFDVKLGALPVNFGLVSSASGSPKLEVDPAFSSLTLTGMNVLAICHDRTLHLFHPNGDRQQLELTVPAAEVLAITPTEGGLRVWTPTQRPVYVWRR